MKLPFTIGNRPIQGNFDALLGALGGNRVVRGVVSGAGAIEEGSGFTVVRNATGDYTVTFSPAFADVPTVLLGIGTSATANYVRISSTVAVTASSVRVLGFTFAGVAADAQFHLIAIGP